MKRNTIIAALVGLLVSIQGLAWGQYPGVGPSGPYQAAPNMWAGPAPGAMQAGPYAGPNGPIAGPYAPNGAPVAMDGGNPVGDACQNCGSCLPTWDIYVDALFLTPRNATVPYGVIFNGPAEMPPPGAVIQVAPPGELLPTYTGGIRGGLMVALDECNSIGVNYLHFENHLYDQISTDIYQIRSLVSQPSTWLSNETSDWSTAAAQQHIILDVAEVNYKWTMYNDSYTTLSVLTAGRYGSFVQRFGVEFAGNGTEDVNTNIHFEGGGMRLGLECLETGKLGFSFYGRGSFSCLAGSFRSSYVQSESFAGTVVDTGYRDQRLVPIIDLEAGVSWTSPGEHVRLSCGFLMSSWFNVIKTTDLIQAVQQNNFDNIGSSTMTFDGLTARVELRF
jgi:hypothetical protein